MNSTTNRKKKRGKRKSKHSTSVSNNASQPQQAAPPQPAVTPQQMMPPPLRSRLLTPDQIPDLQKIEVLLHLSTQALFQGTKNPSYEIVLPPTGPPGANIDITKEMVRIGMRQSDIDETNLSQICPNILLKAMLCDKVRAYRRASPVDLLDIKDDRYATYYIAGNPGHNGKSENSAPVLWRPQLKPVFLLGHTNEMVDHHASPNYSCTFITLSAKHENACSCVDPCINNSLPSLLFCLSCLPKGARTEYKSTKFAKDPRLAIKGKAVTLNQTIIFYDVARKTGTVYGRILLRQSLANLQRDEPKMWKAPYSEVQLLENVNLLLGLLSQAVKAEFNRFTGNFELQEGLSSDTADFRFPDRRAQEACPEVGLRHKKDKLLLDEILNNSVFVSPFHGTYCCLFCPRESNMVKVRGITSLVSHLGTKHRKLMTSWFCCPGKTIPSTTSSLTNEAPP
jgi:hypothetical protein